MMASVLCAAVLTLHHRYQIVCVVKCVSKTPQADESESCGLWQEFQKLTPARSDRNLSILIAEPHICFIVSHTF